MKILFAGTPDFASTILQALIETTHEIVAVYTQPDRPAGRGQKSQISAVKALALSKEIPVEQPLTLKTDEAAQKIAQYQADVMIVAAYGMILPVAILSLPKHGCINVHASLLPRWRGASPIQRAILAGDNETGVTLMQMAAGLDTGDMLVKSACPITNEDTAASLHDKLANLGAAALKENLEKIVFSPHPEVQDEKLVTYAPKITKNEGEIDWQKSALEIDRQIRAFNSWPVAFCHMEEILLRIWQAKPQELHQKVVAGTILAHTAEGILVACKKDALLLTQGQLPGKKVMSFADILHGHADLLAVGKILN